MTINIGVDLSNNTRWRWWV